MGKHDRRTTLASIAAKSDQLLEDIKAQSIRLGIERLMRIDGALCLKSATAKNDLDNFMAKIALYGLRCCMTSVGNEVLDRSGPDEPSAAGVVS